MPNKKISAEEFFSSRDTETVRAKDLSENNLYAPAGIIHDLKMMAEYKKTLFVFKDNYGNYIQIVKWLKQGKVDKLANPLYTSIPVYDFFEICYKDDMFYSLPVTMKRVENKLHSKTDTIHKKSIKHKKGKGDEDRESSTYKKIDRSLGIASIINQYKKIDNFNFNDMLSIADFSEYIKLLPNRYNAYIFLEIIHEYETHIKKLDLFYTFKNKKRKKPKYLNAIKKLREIEYLLPEELKDSLGRVEDILNENITISKDNYRQKIKKKIVQKLEKNGFSNTNANNFYRVLIKKERWPLSSS